MDEEKKRQEKTPEQPEQQDSQMPEDAPEQEPDLAGLMAQLAAERAALEGEKQRFQEKLLQVAVAGELQQRCLPAEFAPFLTGGTPEESGQNIDLFEELYRKALSAGVLERMRGAGVPAEPTKPADYSRETLKKMSAGEINAHWTEISRTLSGRM